MRKLVKSLYGKIVFVLLFTLIFSSVVIGIHSRTIKQNNIRQKITEAQEEIAVYTSAINTSFTMLEENLFFLPSYNQAFQSALRYNTEEMRDTPEYWALVSNIKRQLNTLQMLYPYAECFFVFYPDQNLFLNESINPDMTKLIRELILESGDSDAAGWNHVILPQGVFLFRIYSFNGFHIGAWILCNDISDYFIPRSMSSSDSERAVSLYDFQGYPLSQDYTSLPPDFLFGGSPLTSADKCLISDYSEHPGIYLVEALSGKELSASEPYNRISFLMICLLHLFLFLFLSSGMSRWVLRPVRVLSLGIRKIRSGETSSRLPANSYTSTEFQEIREEFNSMLDNLQEIKIQMYEQQLKQNEVQLRYLSQQIQPHFILNSLNTLYAHIGDDDSSRQIVLLLVQYYRYIIRIESPWVHIGEELDHVRNYLAFQQIRYSDRLSYSIDCDEEARSAPIPPLLLESFVGNCLKYGQDEEDRISLNLTIRKSEGPVVRLLLSDHGTGFPDEVIDAVKQYRTNGKKDSLLGVGICNSLDRLALLYGDEASCFLYNSNGAVIEIIIPSVIRHQPK